MLLPPKGLPMGFPLPEPPAFLPLLRLDMLTAPSDSVLVVLDNV
jgi:hypothetical protein